MSRYDFGFLTVFWGDNDPQGRKKDPLRPPGGPGQPAARRVKKKIFYQRNFWFHSKSQKLCFSAFFYLEIIFSHIFPLLVVPRKAGIGGIILVRSVREF